MGGVCSRDPDSPEQPERRRPRSGGRRRRGQDASVPRRYQDHGAGIPGLPDLGDENGDADGPWDENFPRMTEAELMRKREVFWETRVEGEPHFWQALKLSIEAEEEATSRVILESVGFTPLDFAANYVFTYDDRGRRYDVPMYVVHKPSNLVSEETQMEEAKQKDMENAREALKITFRIRLTIGGPDLQVTCKDTSTMGQIKRKIEKMKQISATRQTVVYQGRSCPDDFSLRALEIVPDTVVQIMVKSAPTEAPSSPPPDSPDTSPSNPQELSSSGTTSELNESTAAEASVAVASISPASPPEMESRADSPQISPDDSVAPSQDPSDPTMQETSVEKPVASQDLSPKPATTSFSRSSSNAAISDPNDIPAAIPATTPIAAA